MATPRAFDDQSRRGLRRIDAHRPQPQATHDVVTQRTPEIRDRDGRRRRAHQRYRARPARRVRIAQRGSDERAARARAERRDRALQRHGGVPAIAGRLQAVRVDDAAQVRQRRAVPHGGDVRRVPAAARRVEHRRGPAAEAQRLAARREDRGGRRGMLRLHAAPALIRLVRLHVVRPRERAARERERARDDRLRLQRRGRPRRRRLQRHDALQVRVDVDRRDEHELPVAGADGGRRAAPALAAERERAVRGDVRDLAVRVVRDEHANLRRQRIPHVEPAACRSAVAAPASFEERGARDHSRRG